MPRARRHFLPGHVWHLTHRCHKKEYLLKLKRDRRFWIKCLFEAKKRYGLCIFNYMVTSNHIHLLVRSDNEDTVSKSMQYVAGRTGQEYNRRKNRKGAFWEDRYHSTAVETGEHLRQCMIYIDLNMIRAGVTRQPGEWGECGFKEVLKPRDRYSLIDRNALLTGLEVTSQEELRACYPAWLDEVLMSDRTQYDERWSRPIAVGSESFVERVKADLGLSLVQHQIRSDQTGSTLRETEAEYGTGGMIPWELDCDAE